MPRLLCCITFDRNIAGVLYIIQKHTQKPKQMKHKVGEIKAVVEMSE